MSGILMQMKVPFILHCSCHREREGKGVRGPGLFDSFRNLTKKTLKLEIWLHILSFLFSISTTIIFLNTVWLLNHNKARNFAVSFHFQTIWSYTIMVHDDICWYVCMQDAEVATIRKMQEVSFPVGRFEWFLVVGNCGCLRKYLIGMQRKCVFSLCRWGEQRGMTSIHYLMDFIRPRTGPCRVGKGGGGGCGCGRGFGLNRLYAKKTGTTICDSQCEQPQQNLTGNMQT